MVSLAGDKTGHGVFGLEWKVQYVVDAGLRGGDQKAVPGVRVMHKGLLAVRETAVWEDDGVSIDQEEVNSTFSGRLSSQLPYTAARGQQVSTKSVVVRDTMMETKSRGSTPNYWPNTRCPLPYTAIGVS